MLRNSGLMIWLLCGGIGLIPHLAQEVKDPALPGLWCRLQLWIRFGSWPRNFHMLQVQLKKKKNANIEKCASYTNPLWIHYCVFSQSCFLFSNLFFFFFFFCYLYNFFKVLSPSRVSFDNFLENYQFYVGFQMYWHKVV